MGKSLEVSARFLGANAGVVTGSATLVTIKRGESVRSILIDYGLFQGDDDYQNYDRMISGDDVDCILLTHSHLDHCGGLPLLFKVWGDNIPYTGRIFGSRETLNQATHILKNSAKLNETNGPVHGSELSKIKGRLNREKDKAVREAASPRDIANIDSNISSVEEEEAEVLYTLVDVDETIRHFFPIDFTFEDQYKDVQLYDGITARFIPTSHINGSCMIELTAEYNGERYTVVFTGDIGRDKSLLYRRIPVPVNPDASSIVLESLHGAESNPQDLSEAVYEFKRILYRAKKKNKTVIIPLFALDRTAGFIKILNKFMNDGFRFDCYIDSPLAMKELFEYIESYQTGSSAWFSYKEFPFSTERMTIIGSYQEHNLAVKIDGFAVFLTSSGMGYGGRVVDYFEHHIQERNSVFIFPGYLVEGSPSRVLHETRQGEKFYIGNRPFKKQCETYWLSGFSSHGYIEEKLRLLRSYPNLTRIFLNHGDESSILSLHQELTESGKYSEDQVVVPLPDEEIVLY
jgi:metallo-beta-lactamase family protein